MTTTGVPFPLPEIVRETIVRLGVTDRRLTEDGFWCHVAGSAPIERVQGWKLHLSATPLLCVMVLSGILGYACLIKILVPDVAAPYLARLRRRAAP